MNENLCFNLALSTTQLYDAHVDVANAEVPEVAARDDGDAQVEVVVAGTATAGVAIVGTVTAGASGEIFVSFIINEILWRCDVKIDGGGEGSGTAGVSVYRCIEPDVTR